jgi:hypothetical protein
MDQQEAKLAYFDCIAAFDYIVTDIDSASLCNYFAKCVRCYDLNTRLYRFQKQEIGRLAQDILNRKKLLDYDLDAAAVEAVKTYLEGRNRMGYGPLLRDSIQPLKYRMRDLRPLLKLEEKGAALPDLFGFGAREDQGRAGPPRWLKRACMHYLRNF